MCSLPTKTNAVLRNPLDTTSAESIASNLTEECGKKGKWSELPSLPLEKIYSYVSRNDQFSMSLVCRKWSEGYGSPSVWKTFRFALTKSQLYMDTCPVMKFVQKYSIMFRHVEIEVTCPGNNSLMNNFCRLVVEFLKILTRTAQLISVKFQNFSYCFSRVDIPTYNDICRAIADFLTSQHHLKRVEFELCSFGYQESVELLRSLIENSRESLTHLKLRGFFYDENRDIHQDSNASQNLPLLADLPSLKTLDMNYSFIFENMVARQSTAIQTVRNCQALVLSKLILCYHYIEIEDFRGLTATDWRFMKKLYPDLQVELIIFTFDARRRGLEFFIVPSMPIARLYYKCDDFDMEMRTDVLFEHLLACKTNDNLVTLHLDWKEPKYHLSSTFIPFLQACKKLRCLELFIFSPISGIDLLLESWLENRPESLQKVIIDVSNIYNENDLPGLINISDYVSLLKLAGLNIRVNLHI